MSSRPPPAPDDAPTAASPAGRGVASDPTPGDPSRGQRSAPTGRGVPRCWSCGTALTGPPPCPRCGNEAPRPTLPRGAGVALARLGKGAAAPLRGLVFVNAHPRLWSWIAAPLVVNSLIFALGAWYLVSRLDGWLPDLEQPWPEWIDWLRGSAGWLLGALMWVLGVAASFGATLLLSGVVNAPLYDLLSDKVERARFGRPDPGRPWSALLGDILRSLTASVSLLARWVLVMALLFALSFTAVGAPLFAVAGWYYLGLSQVDLPLARKLYPGGQRAAWGRRHFTLLVGLGLPVSLLPLLAPFAVVGATLAFLDEPDKA